MKYPKDRNIHRPPHTSLPSTYYFISARTYYSLPYLKHREAKEILKESMDKAVEKFKLMPVSWVILNNHYHWMFKSPGDNSMNAVSLEERAQSDKLQFVTGNRLKPVSLGEGKSVSLGEGKPVSLGEGKSVSLGKGKPVSLGEGKPVNLREGVQNDTLQGVIFNLGKIIGYVHGRSSKLINDLLREEGKKYLYDLTPREFGIIKENFAKKLGPKYGRLEKERVREFERLLETQDTEGLLKFVNKLSKVWYQYTDHAIQGERDFYSHINYTYQNPVKHGYVGDMIDYGFSSIHEAIKRRGKDFILECFEKYPIMDFRPDFEDW